VSRRTNQERPTNSAWKERAYRKASWRLALKVAARTSTRALGRSALIVAMVALPVTGLVAVAVVADSMYSPSIQQRISTELGKSEAKILIVTPPRSGLTQDPLRPDWFAAPNWTDGELTSPEDALPAGTRIIGLTSTTVTAKTATGVGVISAQEGESWDPSLSGIYDVTAGRTPRSDREVMVTASTLPRLGAKVGDTIELRGVVSSSGDAVSTVTIVGLLKDSTLPDSQERIFARPGALSASNPQQDLQNTTYYLPGTTISWDQVKELNSEGLTVLSRTVMLDPPPNDGSYPIADQWILIMSIIVLLSIVAGFAAFEVILLAGAAFTVTARQQQRTLATIASVGAPRKLLFRILAANGIVLGVIGGLFGVAFGIGTAAVFMALTADGSATQYYGFHLPWLGFLAAVAFAVLIGWLASLVPARTTSRFDIVSALRGARKPPTATVKRPIVGLVFLIVGVALTLVGGVLLAVLTEAGRTMPNGQHPLVWVPIVLLIVGPILAQLGLILIGPLLLRGIAKLLGGSGLGARLAARDSARNPGRAVPALAAVMTTVFVAVFGMCVAAGSDATTRDNWQWTMPLGSVRASLDAINYGDGTVAPTRTPYAHPAAIESAIRTSLDIDRMQRIASVPDPLPGPVETDASGGLPAPALDIPPQNLCPLDVRSPDSVSDQGNFGETAVLDAANDPRCNSWYFSGIQPGMDHIYVSDVSGLSLALGREPSAAAQQALASGGAVSLYPGYVDDGTVSISWWSPQQASQLFSSNDPGTPLKTQSLAAVVDLPAHPVYFGIFISPATADRLGLNYHDSTLVASTKTMPTTQQEDALRQAFYALPDNSSQDGANINPTLETGPPALGTAVVWGLLGLAGLIALASSAIAIGLARFDGRQDDATLSALGAGRVVRRSFAFWQAIIIAGIGSVLGAATGLVPAFALGAVGMPFVPPWIPIGIAVVALPLVIACGSWLLATRSKVSARRVAIA
jgi:FtsX-like permease family